MSQSAATVARMPSDGPRAEMTIDEVAREAGTTTRNVRAYQTRGLLPPPRLVGRVGVYGPEHLARLQLIARLQERGYSLAAIDDLVRAWQEQRSLGDLLGGERDIDPLAEDERGIVLAERELARRFPMIVPDDGLLARAIALGIAEPLPSAGGERRWRIPSPRLLDVGQCNDAYSAIQIAVALSKAFNCGVNDLPLSMILSWYEQKAVAILLTLLFLGIKNIRLGPSLPAFITPNVLNVLVEKFNIAPIKTPDEDLKAILG